MQPIHPIKPWRRGGFTLVEMIVVIGIMAMVTTVAIRVAVPDAESRRMREAARQVDIFIHGARARAIEANRPFGVRIIPEANGGAIRLTYVQVPEPYAGDTYNSRAEIVSASQIRITDVGWQGIVAPGDLIQLNHVGHVYQLTNTPNSGVWTLVSTDPAMGEIPYDPGLLVPYKVLRNPVKAGGDLELPEGVVLDTTVSGIGNAAIGPPSGGNITFLFSPSGRLTAASAGGAGFAPGSTLYLNVGKAENLGLGGPTNVDDLGSYWVSINGQTGLVTTAENAGGSLFESRRFVRDKLAIGAK